ncbi:hypothetical protein [Actinomadura atramentaria]|uniref:hypothetical protein n=1 Tax=Actinomadura atramentaria TaxID=1990 RepID=UPI00039FAC25|nr:hypothetical protein [Actinomadura atramentaria]
MDDHVTRSRAERRAAMCRRLSAVDGTSEVRIGWIHDVFVSTEYDGVPGVTLPMTMLRGDGDVSTLLLWMPVDGVPELRAVLRKLESSRFRRALRGLRR